MATVIDEYNGDNFDHGGLGFIGGAYIAGMVTGVVAVLRGGEQNSVRRSLSAGTDEGPA